MKGNDKERLLPTTGKAIDSNGLRMQDAEDPLSQTERRVGTDSSAAMPSSDRSLL